MPIVDPAGVRAFRAHGYVLLLAVLDGGIVGRGRNIAAAMLAARPPAAGHAGPYFRWPAFAAGGHPLLDFYREAGVAELAASLLRPDLAVTEPDFAQLATTIPPWPHRPGGPHVDGLTPPPPDGLPGTFSLLCGIWLSDHREHNQGNLWVWPGTHLRFGAWLADRGRRRADPDRPDESGTVPAGGARRSGAGHRPGGQRAVRALPARAQYRRA